MKCCSCAWYLDRAICKHLVGACIKTMINFPGFVFMSKVFVCRWRLSRPLYTSQVKPIYDDNLDNQIDQSQSKNVLFFHTVLRSNPDFVVTSKPKRSRKKFGRTFSTFSIFCLKLLFLSLPCS